MQLPAGTVDYALIKANLSKLKQPNFKRWMAPKIITDRKAIPKRRRKQTNKMSCGEMIIFPSGVLGSDGSFVGAVALAAHLDRIIREVSPREAC